MRPLSDFLTAIFLADASTTTASLVLPSPIIMLDDDILGVSDMILIASSIVFEYCNIFFNKNDIGMPSIDTSVERDDITDTTMPLSFIPDITPTIAGQQMEAKELPLSGS